MRLSESYPLDCLLETGIMYFSPNPENNLIGPTKNSLKTYRKIQKSPLKLFANSLKE